MRMKGVSCSVSKSSKRVENVLSSDDGHILTDNQQRVINRRLLNVKFGPSASGDFACSLNDDVQKLIPVLRLEATHTHRKQLDLLD